MRTLSIVERRAVGGGLSSAGIRSQLGGYGATPNGEGGAGGGGGLAPNVAGTFTYIGNSTWQNTGANMVVSLVCAPGTIFGFQLGQSTSGKIVNALTGVTVTPAPDCKIVTVNTQTGIKTECPLQGGNCTVTDTKTGRQLSSATEPDVDQSGLSSVSVGESAAVEMGGSDLAGGAIAYGSFGDYGGFGLGGDN